MQYTVEELYNKKEGQTYDRKSARKDPKSLSNHIVAFANADGGTLVIGIEDDFTVSGIDSGDHRRGKRRRVHRRNAGINGRTPDSQSNHCRKESQTDRRTGIGNPHRRNHGSTGTPEARTDHA